MKCLNCGYEFDLKKVYTDELGDFTVCPKCEGRDINAKCTKRSSEISNLSALSFETTLDISMMYSLIFHFFFIFH